MITTHRNWYGIGLQILIRIAADVTFCVALPPTPFPDLYYPSFFLSVGLSPSLFRSLPLFISSYSPFPFLSFLASLPLFPCFASHVLLFASCLIFKIFPLFASFCRLYNQLFFCRHIHAVFTLSFFYFSLLLSFHSSLFLTFCCFNILNSADE